MFRKIVIETNRMALAITEKLAHGRGSKGRDVLHRSWLGGRGRDNDAELKGTVIGKCFHNLGDRRTLLSDRAVDANHISAALVQDCVENNCRLARLTVADDQFTLAAANGNHRIDGLDARLQRLADRLAVDYPGSESLEWIALVRRYGALAIKRRAERVHNAADERVPDRNGHD